jgi:hypothetical protein
VPDSNIPPPPDFSDPSFIGSGRQTPAPRPNPERGKDSLDHLNMVKGTKIRVLKDNGRKGLLGLTGVVVQSFPGYVVVKLEQDPILSHRINQKGGLTKHRTAPLRHFRVTEVERLL